MRVTPGKIKEVHQKQSEIDFVCENGNARISIICPKIVRVQASKTSKYRDYDSVSRIEYKEETKVKLEKQDDEWIIHFHGRHLTISNMFAVSVYDKNGQLVHQDAPENHLFWENKRVTCEKQLLDDEVFYGLGEKTNGLNKRGLQYEMWNTDNVDHGVDSDPLYQSVPFFIVLNQGIAYGIFFDNSYRTFFDFGKSSQNTFSFGAPDGPLDYYIILGPRIADVIDGYTKLTGRPYFIPKWALGYHQSRWEKYKAEEDVLSVARSLRDNEIPCDAIVLDIDYMDEYKIFTWDREVFPDPKSFIEKITELGLRVVTIIDPGIKKEEGYWMYDEGLENGYFLKKPDGSPYVGLVWPGETVFPDFSKQRVREWFGTQYRRLIELGVSNSSWLDMNEPSHCMYQGLEEEYSISEVLDDKGEPWEKRNRNTYALEMTRAVFEGLKKIDPDQRPFIYTRSGFSGYQRYAGMWTGDNRSNWNHLWMSIPMLCNIGLSGVPICGVDICGFSNDITPELLARWYQVGVFYPFCRNHTRFGTARQEPWVFGEKVLAIAREYIFLRYHLLRYLYSLAWQASQTGAPIMRPLVYEFQSDVQTYSLDTQFMVGPFIMIAPILEKGKVSRSVYFPDGLWYDFWSNERITGGINYEIRAPLERLPIFIRAGATIPVGDVAKNTNHNQGNLRILIYPGRSARFEIYEDDGVSEHSDFCSREVCVETEKDVLRVIMTEADGNMDIPDRHVILEVRGMQEAIVRVQVDEVDVEVEGDEKGAYFVKFPDDGLEHSIVFQKES